MKHDSSEEDAIVLLKKCGYHIEWPNGCRSLPVRENGCYMMDICEDRAGGKKEVTFHFVPSEGPQRGEPSLLVQKKRKNGKAKHKKSKS